MRLRKTKCARRQIVTLKPWRTSRKFIEFPSRFTTRDTPYITKDSHGSTGEKFQMIVINDKVRDDLIWASPSPLDAQRSLFNRVRRISSELVVGLSDADASGQSMPDASPSKWHLAHTTWFFETFVLRDFVQGYRLLDPAYAFLHNSYYEAEGDRLARPLRGLLTRPSLDEVREYRRHVDIAMMRAIDDLPMAARDLLLLGCNHEEQHQELLLTDLLHLFAQNPLFPRAFAAR